MTITSFNILPLTVPLNWKWLARTGSGCSAVRRFAEISRPWDATLFAR